MGNAHPSIAPYELYATGDGELVLAVGNDRQFAALCEVLGAPELATDPRFATKRGPGRAPRGLGAELERLLAARPAAEWAALLARRVPAGGQRPRRRLRLRRRSSASTRPSQSPASDGTTVSLTRNPVRYHERPPATDAPRPSWTRIRATAGEWTLSHVSNDDPRSTAKGRRRGAPTR